jgi:hypothetical protein
VYEKWADVAEKFGPAGVLLLGFTISGRFYFNLDMQQPMYMILAHVLAIMMVVTGVTFISRLFFRWPKIPDMDKG